MKRRFLLSVLAATLSYTLAFAQSCQVSGTWKKLPQDFKDYRITMLDRLGDDYVVLMHYEYGGKKLAVVDENFKILRSMDFITRRTPRFTYAKDGKESSGRASMKINNGVLEHLYADFDETAKCRVLSRHSYDLNSMTLVKNEVLMSATDLEPGAKDLLGGIRSHAGDRKKAVVLR